jgi:GNAT superfamily N-acetyltransferase
MSPVTVRPAELADLARIQDVFRESSLSNADDRAELLAHPEVLQFAPDPLTEGRSRVAVDSGGAVAGFATFVIADGTFELEDLFVDPRRMRQGIGRRLVEDLVVLAADRGFRSIRVIANGAALAFYAAMGFVPDGSAQTRFGPASRLRLDLTAS